MGPMILQREVLPPRPAPSAESDCDFVSAEKQLRTSITRSSWTLLLLAGLVSIVSILVRMLEKSL